MFKSNSIASAFIASQERIAEGIDNLRYDIQEVGKGIEGLKAAFEWGIADVVWQIEQNTAVLHHIAELLSKPLDTQAKELRKRGEYAYANGWIEDALEDFSISEKKNRYDFIVHISLGNIYLFHKKQPAKAFEYYDKAAKYSRPESSYYASYALLHQALIKYLEKDFKEAERLSREAIDLSPNFTEALYQNALYNALLSNADKSVQNLEKIIKVDVNYCEKIINESDFNPISNSINDLFKKVRDEEKKKVISDFELVKSKKSKLDEIKIEMSKHRQLTDDIKNSENQYEKLLKRLEMLIKRNSYRDYLEASKLVKELNIVVNQIKTILLNNTKNIINTHRNDSAGNKKQNKETLTKIYTFASMIVIFYIIPCWLSIKFIDIDYPIKHDGDAYYWAYVPLLNMIFVAGELIFLLKSIFIGGFLERFIKVFLLPILLFFVVFIVGKIIDNMDTNPDENNISHWKTIEKRLSAISDHL